MAKIDKDLKIKIDALTDEQLERKVEELKQTIPDLNVQLDYTARLLRDRRQIAYKKAIDDVRRSSK